MITLEIMAAASDRVYEFHLDENTLLRNIIEEIVSMICQKEQVSQDGCEELLLCDIRRALVLSSTKTFADYGILTGDRLLLV